jgi:hypothetical protein
MNKAKGLLGKAAGFGGKVAQVFRDRRTYGNLDYYMEAIL